MWNPSGPSVLQTPVMEWEVSMKLPSTKKLSHPSMRRNGCGHQAWMPAPVTRTCVWRAGEWSLAGLAPQIQPDSASREVQLRALQQPQALKQCWIQSFHPSLHPSAGQGSSCSTPMGKAGNLQEVEACRGGDQGAKGDAPPSASSQKCPLCPLTQQHGPHLGAFAGVSLRVTGSLLLNFGA